MVAKDPMVEASADIESIKADVASLRDDLRSLAGHLKAGATKGLNKETQRLYESVMGQGSASLETISHQIEEKPLLSLVLAFAAGFIGGRLARR